MPKDYFTRINSQTDTRFWINNPTVPEVEQALDHGAVACTTNPTYGANMLRRDEQYARSTIRDCLPVSDNDHVVADQVQQQLVARILRLFAPLYEGSQGRQGFVSIQGNPYADVDPEHIVKEAQEYQALGANFIAKIPATEAGLVAIGRVLREGMPVIATEIFGVSQMIAACEVYEQAASESGKRPAYFVTHITGIFDDYLRHEVVEPLRIQIEPHTLAQAGLAVMRKQYRVFTERGYDGVMLGGGARGIQHFTGCVGGEMHVTINWSTAEELLQINPPIEDQIREETPRHILDELVEKLPDFRFAWEDTGLTRKQFKDYGPVQRFRRQFISGWDQLVAAVREERAHRITA